jgi:hypothetical protein
MKFHAKTLSRQVQGESEFELLTTDYVPSVVSCEFLMFLIQRLNKNLETWRLCESVF